MYNWSGPLGTGTVDDTLLVANPQIADSGIYDIVAEDTRTGCTSDTTRITFLVNARPVAPINNWLTYECVQDTVRFGVDTSFGTCDSIVWYRSSSLLFNPFASVPQFNNDSIVTLVPGDSLHRPGWSFWAMECIDPITGCSDTSNVTWVIIDDSLDLNTATAIPGIVCPGDSVQLQVQTPRRWYYQYDWYADSNFTTFIDDGYTAVVPNVTAATTVYLEITTLGGCSSRPIPVSLSVYPTTTPDLLGDVSYCEGDSIVLSTTAPALQYAWGNPNGIWPGDTTTVNEVVVTPNATSSNGGLYTLQVRDPSGCWSDFDTLSLVVEPQPGPPILLTPLGVCRGEPFELRINNPSCARYRWVGSNAGLGLTTVIDTTASILIIGPNDPLYRPSTSWTVSCITSAGCVSLPSTAVQATIWAPPVLNPIATPAGRVVCHGDTAIAIGSVPPLVTIASSGWYTDPGGNNLITTQDTLVLTPVFQNTLAYFIISDANGCQTRDSILFTVRPPLLPPLILGDTLLCDGDTLALSVDTLYAAYQWRGPNGVTSTGANLDLIVDPSFTGTYSVRVQDFFGCWSPVSAVTVDVRSLPTARVNPSFTRLCEGDDLTLTATATGVGTVDYFWYRIEAGPPPRSVFVQSGTPLVVNSIQANEEGGYYVKVDQGGCFAYSDTVLVAVDTASTVYLAQAGPDTVLCDVDSLVLRAQTNFPSLIRGQWTAAGGGNISNPNQATTWVYGLPSGVQTFYWSLSVGTCSDYSMDTVQVEYVPRGTAVANAGLDQTICNLQIATLDGTPNNLNGQWRQDPSQVAQGVGILAPSDPNTQVVGLQLGNSYSFIWELAHPVCGPYAQDTVEIEVIAPPSTPAEAGLDEYICGPDDLLLEAVAPPSGLIGEWTTNSGALIQDPNDPLTTVIDVPAGETAFIWTLSSLDCPDYSSDTIFVWQTLGLLSANVDAIDATNGPVFLDVLDNDFLPPLWTIELIELPEQGEVFYLQAGNFEIDMEDVGSNQSFVYELCDSLCPDNCDTAVVWITIDDAIACAVPNIFTPNEDGVNDHFEIPCVTPQEDLRIVVFNRWGDTVYENDQYENDWDGSHRGEPLPDGTYFYVLYRSDRDPIQGSVEIKR